MADTKDKREGKVNRGEKLFNFQITTFCTCSKKIFHICCLNIQSRAMQSVLFWMVRQLSQVPVTRAANTNLIFMFGPF